ncbi:MAG: sensor histidine kinase [Vulcanimicrobiaceae bacterium]
MRHQGSLKATLLRPDLGDVLERITDGFFALDADWHIVYMNREAQRMLHTDASCLGKVWVDVFPLAGGTAFEREYHRAMAEQRVVQFVEFSRTSDSWFEVKAYPSPDGVSVYFRDVTDRIKAERDLAERTEQQQALVEFGRLALSRVSVAQLANDALELLGVYLNAPVVEVFLYDQGARVFRVIASHGWNQPAHARSQMPLDQPVRQALEDGHCFRIDDVANDPSIIGRELFATSKIQSGIWIPMGSLAEPLAMVAAFVEDPGELTPARISFAESVATTFGEALQAWQSHHRTDEILESITDAFVACDRELRITYVNARMAAFYQVEPAALVGRHVEQFLSEPDDLHVLSAFKTAIAEHHPTSVERYVVSMERWFDVRLYPWGGGIAAYIRDITKRKLAELQIRQLNADLERRVEERTRELELANQELESFAYSVSHDLRAPLRAIDGFSQALMEDCSELIGETGQGYLKRVRSAAQRMAELIDALLQLAKIARHELIRSPVNLSDMAKGILDELALADAQRSVQTRIEPNLFVVGEPALLRVALANLIGNAWKFTRLRRDAVITVGSSPGGEFFVRDNGAGFDMHYADKLFGAFQRLHSYDEFEGTGIGLATVARVVYRHGGSIRAEGRVGEGATFYFTLPAEVHRTR